MAPRHTVEEARGLPAGEGLLPTEPPSPEEAGRPVEPAKHGRGQGVAGRGWLCAGVSPGTSTSLLQTKGTSACPNPSMLGSQGQRKCTTLPPHFLPARDLA